MPAFALTTSATVIPKCRLRPADTITCLNKARDEEIAWIKHAQLLLDKENVTSQDAIAWAAYHTSHQLPLDDFPCISALLPLFYEKTATLAIIKHGMDVQNGQFSILIQDKSLLRHLINLLFALAKLGNGQKITHFETLLNVLQL